MVYYYQFVSDVVIFSNLVKNYSSLLLFANGHLRVTMLSSLSEALCHLRFRQHIKIIHDCIFKAHAVIKRNFATRKWCANP